MSETLKRPRREPAHGPWQTPFETLPFAEVRPEHFAAFEQAFADHSAEIAAITHDPTTPDFANTITAMERSGSCSRRSLPCSMTSSRRTQSGDSEIDKEVSLRMARHWNPIVMNAVLFGRIAMLHEKRANARPDRRGAVAPGPPTPASTGAGAGLDEAAKIRMAEINERLAQLGTTFSHHLLGDEQERFMELGEDDRAGLPDSFIAAARPRQKARHGRQGDDVVASSVEPFLQSSPAATCAKGLQLHRAANGNANDNNAIIVEILRFARVAAPRLRPMQPTGSRIGQDAEAVCLPERV
jgi:peptidyl-dipeptidase Dcp